MLRTLALIAVRQQTHKSRLCVPLGLTSADKLVKDDLSTVRKVAELCLPDAEVARALQRDAVLEAQHAELRERRVPDTHAALLVGRDVVEHIPLDGRVVAHKVVQDSVAVAEGAALHVLAAVET